MNKLMLRILTPAILIMPLSMICLLSCGQTQPAWDSKSPAIHFTTTGSDWQTADLAYTLSPAGTGWDLRLATTATARPAQTVLLEIRFPDNLTAQDTSCILPAGELNLLVTDRPGVLALGVIMPPGELLKPGQILRARLEPAGAVARVASATPHGSAGFVPDLGGTENGLGSVIFDWGYYSTGDLNQDGQVAISDLAVLGAHFGEVSPLAPQPFPPDSIGAVVDTDGNTQIGIADLTPIGINYLNRVDGYHLYQADGPDPGTATSTQVLDVPFSSSSAAAGSRRRFSAELYGTGLVDGAYYFVKPYEAVTLDEGAASAVYQFERTIHLKFYRPSPGDHVLDTNQSQNPSLVLMPGITGVSAPGAPVVVYTALGSGGGLTPLMLGYFGEGGWTTEDIGAGGNFSNPQALWLDAAGQGLVVAQDLAASQLVARRYNERWEPLATETVGTGSGTISQVSLDYAPATDTLGVAHAYTAAGGGNVVYSTSSGGGAWSTEPVYDGETIGGLSFRFDPAGGAPWVLFTHGTTTASTGLISLSYKLEQGRRTGGSWIITNIPYPDSPLVVNLGFREDNTPQFVCTAARDFTLTIPGSDPWTISMLYDVATGEYNGTKWVTKKQFDSTLGFSIPGFPPTTLVLELNLASGCSWARADEIIYPVTTGNLEYNLTTQLPEDGGLANDVTYMVRTDTGTYAENSYYTGTTGRNYDWALNPAGTAVCAYIRSSTITVQDILSGNLNLAGELAYWEP